MGARERIPSKEELKKYKKPMTATELIAKEQEFLIKRGPEIRRVMAKVQKEMSALVEEMLKCMKDSGDFDT